MRLLILGTGGYHPNERRHTACLLVPELGLAFDAGSSVFRVASRLESKELDVFLTHAHLDHIMGLTFLLVPMMKGEITRCRIHAELHIQDAVKQHLFATPIFPVLPQFEFVTLAGQIPVAIGRAMITHCPLPHPGGSRGFMLAVDGRRLAYITDTIVDGSYTEFIRGADVLIHECNFPDSMAQWCQQTGHSHTSQVAALAKEAGVGKLYLTHIDPQCQEDDPVGLDTARALFADTTLAEDLMEIEF
jgi:ribonuclease BN (tRNA processing enzyme)